MHSRTSPAVIVAGLLSIFAAGCGEDTETMPKAFLQLLNDTTDVLKEIKDEPTAHAAEPKLKELADRKAKLDVQAKATKLSADGIKKSDEKYAQPMKDAADKMGDEIMRIATSSPEAAEIVAKAMGMR